MLIALDFLLLYLLGSVPNALIFGELLKGIDLRQHGSGNLGATNAFRVLGKGPGTLILVLDILKGVVAILLARYVFFASVEGAAQNFYLCLAAVAVVAGHNWTIFLKFKGGKGMATSLGVMIAFAIVIERFVFVMIAVVVLWAVLFLSTGFVSLASVICSVLVPFFGILFHLPKILVAFLAILGMFSLIRHKSNIRR